MVTKLGNLPRYFVYKKQSFCRILPNFCIEHRNTVTIGTITSITSTSTYSSTRQSRFLTYGCFCLGGPIHHKPFKRHHGQAGHFCWREQDSHNTGDFMPDPYSSRIGLGGFCSYKKWHIMRLAVLKFCQIMPRLCQNPQIMLLISEIILTK